MEKDEKEEVEGGNGMRLTGGEGTLFLERWKYPTTEKSV